MQKAAAYEMGVPPATSDQYQCSAASVKCMQKAEGRLLLLFVAAAFMTAAWRVRSDNAFAECVLDWARNVACPMSVSAVRAAGLSAFSSRERGALV